MKKILYMLLCLFLLVGCTHQTGGNTPIMKDPIELLNENNTIAIIEQKQHPNVYRIFDNKHSIDGFIDFNNGIYYSPGQEFNWRTMTINNWDSYYCTFHYDKGTKTVINDNCNTDIVWIDDRLQGEIQVQSSKLLNILFEDYTLDDDKNNQTVIEIDIQDIIPFYEKLDMYMKENYNTVEDSGCEECIQFMKDRYCHSSMDRDINCLIK